MRGFGVANTVSLIPYKPPAATTKCSFPLQTITRFSSSSTTIPISLRTTSSNRSRNRNRPLPLSRRGFQTPSYYENILLVSVSSSSSSSSSSSNKRNSDSSPDDFYYNNNVNDDNNNNNFIVVNFYHFVFLKHPQDHVSKQLAFLQGLDIHGRIYLNEQGINAQYSGPSKDALAYLKWLREDHRFSDVLVQISPALNGHVFPRLKLRYKPSLVQLEGGISHLPLLDPSMRATPLTPTQWRDKLEAKKKVEISNADLNSGYILLDVRNGYEWDIGHFQGAQRPDVDCFRSTSFGLSQPEVIASDPLARVDKEKTDILMYCTGGIRCDVYSAILRQRGFNNLYTLKGGVSHYLKNEGPVEWVGNLFVFDSRLSLPPSTFKPDVLTDANRTQVVSKNSNSSFAVCYICGSQLSELRHRNCANIDCNLLFLCCTSCMKDLRGCCCSKCTSATRLRPVLPAHQRYQKWHYYRDPEVQSR